MNLIYLNTAMSITGLTKRTLWRHIKSGRLSAVSAGTSGERTRVHMEEVLALSCIPLEPEDSALILEADSGNAEAQCDLGLLFLNAGRATDAVFWLELAAKQADPTAMCYLARCCLSGEGVRTNEEAGLVWLTHAAAKGHAIAQALLESLQSTKGKQLRLAQNRQS